MKNNRIIFILDNLYPNGKASAARVRSYGKGFVSNGIDVEVLLPAPRQRYSSQCLNPQSRGIDRNGVSFRYMAGTSMRSKNIFVRKLKDLYGYSSTLLYILTQCKKDDYIVLYEGSPLWHKLCVIASHLTKKKVGIELNELPYGTGAETDRAKCRRKIMLTKIFPKLDFIFAISETLKELGEKYAPQAKIIKVPIIIEGNLYSGETESPKIPYLFHSGSLYEQKDGICGMLEAFGIACQQIKRPIEYILTGNIDESPHAKELKHIIEKYNLKDKVRFVGFLDVQTLRAYQKNCFLTIINKYDTQQNRYCFSTKLSEYLYFSRPVITTTVGEANYYLKDGVNAFIVEPHNSQLIADKIIYAFEHPEIAKKIGEEAHKLISKEFDCIYQTKRIINMLDMQ